MSSRSDRSKHRYSGTSEFLAHVQLDDDPRAPVQQSFGEEFRQHDGVVTILMYYRRRASPKHHDNITEVEYSGGGHRTRLRNDHVDQLCVLGCPPAPVYKGGEGEARPAPKECARRSPTPTGSRTPLPCLVGEGRREGERKKGGTAPLPCPIRIRGEGRAAFPSRPSSFPLSPIWAH